MLVKANLPGSQRIDAFNRQVARAETSGEGYIFKWDVILVHVVLPEVLNWEWKFCHILGALLQCYWVKHGQVAFCLVSIPYVEAFQTWDDSVAEDSDALQAFQRDCHEIKVRFLTSLQGLVLRFGHCKTLKLFDLCWPFAPGCQQLPGNGKLPRVFLVASVGRPSREASDTLVCPTGNWHRGIACPCRDRVHSKISLVRSCLYRFIHQLALAPSKVKLSSLLPLEYSFASQWLHLLPRLQHLILAQEMEYRYNVSTNESVWVSVNER